MHAERIGIELAEGEAAFVVAHTDLELGLERLLRSGIDDANDDAFAAIGERRLGGRMEWKKYRDEEKKNRPAQWV